MYWATRSNPSSSPLFTGLPLCTLKGYLAKVFKQAFVGDLAKLLQQLTVVSEVDPKNLRQAEGVLTVWKRVRY